MSLMKVLGKKVLPLIRLLDKMENPQIEVAKLSKYQYKGKTWQIMILIRDEKQ